MLSQMLSHTVVVSTQISVELNAKNCLAIFTQNNNNKPQS